MVSLVERIADADKYVSPLVFVEGRSAIRRRERAHQITPDEAAMALAELLGEMRRVIQQPIDSRVVRRCESVLDVHALRTLDALQLATALVVRERHASANLVYFVCSDQKLLQAAQAEQLPVWNPEDA